MLAAPPSTSVTTLSFPGPRDMRKNTHPILTTVHSNHVAELFLELLRQVNTVIYVRTAPWPTPRTSTTPSA